MKFTLTRKSNDRAWPGYIFWGRVRTSTAGLVVAFVVLSWAYQTFQPAPKPPDPAATQIVPPGFVPDPAYTWVPRTNVSEPTPRRTYTSTEEPTTTSPTTTSPTITTSPTSPTSPTSSTPTTSPAPGAPSTVDPDGPGPLPPTTVTSPTPRTLLPGITLPPLPAPPAAPPR